MQRTLCLLFFVLEALACTAIDGERILAQDLAKTIPSFLSMEPDVDLGPAPSPGVKRILSRTQLARLATTHEIPTGELPESLCLERKQAVLEPELLLATIERAAREILPGDEVRVEMLDYTRYPMPAGSLNFQRPGISGGAGKALDSALLWRGTLTTATRRSLPIWVKAKVLAKRPCWRAKADLVAGVVLTHDQFERSDDWINPFLSAAECADPGARSAHLRRPLRAGQPLLRSDVTAVPPVRRGDRVQASLEVATATLSFDAVAEMDGTDGQSVFIKRDGRRLRARVVGPATVQVIPQGGIQ
jgi:flagella basal body P-ring formation protein FlgA